MKTTHRKKGPAMSVKSSRTKKSNATSRNVSRQNRSRQTMKVSPKPRKKSKI
jgi:hypothetical protein